MRISDWSSDVCSSDLCGHTHSFIAPTERAMSKINEYPLLCQIGPEHPNLLALADAVCRNESHLDAWIALGVTRCFDVPGRYIIQQTSTRADSADRQSTRLNSSH